MAPATGWVLMSVPVQALTRQPTGSAARVQAAVVLPNMQVNAYGAPINQTAHAVHYTNITEQFEVRPSMLTCARRYRRTVCATCGYANVRAYGFVPVIFVVQ